MRYMLLQHHAEPTDEHPIDPEAMEAGRVAMTAYAATLHAAGVLIGAEILAGSPNSTTVSVTGDDVRIQDGPFADTKEQLGGVFVIDVADLDAALEWARQAPAAEWGTVEVRPSAIHTVGGEWVRSA
ncbi:MAG: YciI family protein [Solirubrobacteraceae bacterium]|nr:YciI family protein [Patulibacter sp.]